jgi:aminoglycoside 6'-N-acetyltransferase I
MMKIRPVTQEDADAWLRMRSALWPDGDADHPREIERFFSRQAREPLAVLVAEDGGELLGFAELSIRPYAEGCSTDRVGYLEGWYVASETRRRGVGRALILAAEDWARSQGCREFASDADLENNTSQQAHLACGFEEVGQIRCFRRPLETMPPKRSNES